MRSRRSSRDSRPSTAVEDGEESDNCSVEGERGCRATSVPKPREKQNTSPLLTAGETTWTVSSQEEALPEAPVPLVQPSAEPQETLLDKEKMEDIRNYRRPRLRSNWSCSVWTIAVTLLSGFLLWCITKSYRELQCDVKGCRMSRMAPVYLLQKDFDTEHTRLASKYNLHLYRESNIDFDYPPKGVPVLFIPGNAGSYKQVRSIAAEAARQFKDVISKDEALAKAGSRNLDFFTVDFNEDITAWHGQTLLDQAEYLNEAVAYILSLYHDSRKSTMDSDLPDPSSVIILAHSMGGIVARTMLIMPNYQSNSINTIITMSAPHAMPPVSFDQQIVKTYDDINNYWRKSFSEKWANQNPLWHVTLISIAGGGLDTVVPSDYASISSLVPETHGFTVFTSSIPNVWLGVDHLAILWCDQLMKVVAQAMLDIVDVTRPGQTKPRAERMRQLKKWFLTGMEPVAEKSLPPKEPTTLLTLEDNSHSITPIGQRLVLRHLGEAEKPRAYLMPIPPTGGPGNSGPGSTAFTLLTDQRIDAGPDGKLEIMFCSVFPLQAGYTAQLLSMNMDLSGESSGSTRVACKNAAEDVIRLPASTRTSKQPFEEIEPFSYLQYSFEDIAEHQFVAIVDKATSISPGWVIAEFVGKRDSHVQSNITLASLLMNGFRTTYSADRPMVMDLNIPIIQSSLLTYKLDIGTQACGDNSQLFTPLVRQYMSDPFESKFFVNVHSADINIHGTAPFVPPALQPNTRRGISIQMWSDPTCNTSVDITVQLDFMGSLGRVVMRYRTVFAAFPLLMVALVLAKQFQAYDINGRFPSFGEGLDLFVAHTLPYVLALLSLIALFVSFSRTDTAHSIPSPLADKKELSNLSPMEFEKNDILLGLLDPFFWFLAPVFALLAVSACVIVNYIAMSLVHGLAAMCAVFDMLPNWKGNDRRRSGTAPFSTSSPRRRLLTTAVLLFFVGTLIPYQFAYMVACIVQLVTCVRGVRYARENGYGERSGHSADFYNYAYSILVVMLWILPINLPVLVVWRHNLAVHWLTPFSSHHNLLSIVPFILLVETHTTGNMVPRITNRLRYVTQIILLGLAAYSALYGVAYAYNLHHLVNGLAAWLVVLHFCSTRPTVAGLVEMLMDGDDDHSKKRHQ